MSLKGLSISQNAKGKWVARRKSIFPASEKQVTFDKKSDAVNFQKDRIRKYERQRQDLQKQTGLSNAQLKKMQAKMPTLGELVEEYFSLYKKTHNRINGGVEFFEAQLKSKNTIHQYIQENVNTPINQIKDEDVKTWFDLYRTSPSKHIKGRLPSISACRKQKNHFSAAYKALGKKYHLESNPFGDKNLIPKTPEGKPLSGWGKGQSPRKDTLYEQEQIDALRAYGKSLGICYETYARPANPEHEIFLAAEIALATGLRLQEVLNAEVKEIDHENKMLHVPASKSKEGARDPSRAKDICLFEPAYSIYCALRKTALVNGELFRLKTKKITRNGKENKWATNVFGSVLVAAGAKETSKGEALNFHCLRSNAATRFVEQGISPYHLMSQLGHKDIKESLSYYSRSSLKNNSNDLHARMSYSSIQ